MAPIRHNWSGLHEDLLFTIAAKLDTIEDFISFGAVCRPWRSATINKHQFPLFSKALFPWLMLPQNEDYAAFFSPLENNICIMRLPEIIGCQCWGSPFGWLLTQRGLEIHLLNPFSRTRIQLPSRVDSMGCNHENPLQNMCKAVIVSITDNDNAQNAEYLVFAIIGDAKHLVATKYGLDTWITIHKCDFRHDIVQSNGVFYTVDMYGSVNSFHKNYIAKSHAISPSSILGPYNNQFYLVELDQELHMAVRNWSQNISGCKTISIQVYRLGRKDTREWDGLKFEWEEIDSLGDYVIFIGSNASFALKASQYPGCKPNCIYFTADKRQYRNRFNDMGILNMETRNIEYLYQGLSSPSVWIMPRIM